MNFLKFRYFFLFFLFLGCGESEKKQESAPADASAVQEEQQVAGSQTILFFGDSLTAGLGVDASEAFPDLIQQQLDSLNLSFQVINAGLSGETTAGGKNRLNWVLKQQVDIFVLELGANDGLRGIPLEETRRNLQAIINAVREKNVNTRIILAGMQIPPNMGPEYTREFRALFPELAESNNLSLIPFLLEGVGGVPELNQEDGIHPPPEGHKKVAKNVWPVLETVILELSS